MAEPRATDDDRKNKPKPGPWGGFFNGPRCPDVPDREQPQAEKREPF